MRKSVNAITISSSVILVTKYSQFMTEKYRIFKLRKYKKKINKEKRKIKKEIEKLMAEELNTRFNSLQDVKESNHTKDEKKPLKPRNRKFHKNEVKS